MRADLLSSSIAHTLKKRLNFNAEPAQLIRAERVYIEDFGYRYTCFWGA